ncbi:MAG: aldo/keto reductase, partial [Fibrobacteres bacterium]|nr:aldo/keto reductase [Fibrobacterota bacterium]
MKTRTLGRTGLQVSEIGLGCGGKFGFTETSEEAAETILNHAIANGVNFFDTGSNYGQGLSEVRLGRYLKENRKKVILTTKCGSRLFGEVGKETYVKRDFTYQGLLTSAEESLKRLKTDYVDLMQLHTAPADAIKPDSEAMAALKEMQKRGMTRFIGASCDIGRGIDIINIGILDTIQVSFNICM